MTGTVSGVCAPRAPVPVRACMVAPVKSPATSSRNGPALTLAVEGPLETPIPPAFHLDARSAGRSLLLGPRRIIMLFPLCSRISLWRLNSGFPRFSSARSRSSYGGAGPERRAEVASPFILVSVAER